MDLGEQGRTGHVAVSYEGYMFVWGGYRENPNDVQHIYYSGSELLVYSYLSEKWFMMRFENDDCPPGMSGSTSTLINGSMYLFGGYEDNNGCSKRVYKLDLDQLVWTSLNPTGQTPMPSDKSVSWQYEDDLYIFGGFAGVHQMNDSSFQFIFYEGLWRGWTNQFFKYDTRKNHWSIPEYSGPIPCARAAHAAAVLEDKAYVFGGRCKWNRMNDLHCLDMKTLTWSGEMPVCGPVPVGRSWHSLTALPKRYLLLYGGFTQDNRPLSDCWMYDTESNVWHPVELPFQREKPRLWHSACLSSFHELIVYGGASVNILDPRAHNGLENSTELIIVRVIPKSLFRLCIDALLNIYENLPPSYQQWKILPRTVQKVLKLRIGEVPLMLAGS